MGNVPSYCGTPRSNVATSCVPSYCGTQRRGIVRSKLLRNARASSQVTAAKATSIDAMPRLEHEHAARGATPRTSRRWGSGGCFPSYCGTHSSPGASSRRRAFQVTAERTCTSQPDRAFVNDARASPVRAIVCAFVMTHRHASTHRHDTHATRLRASHRSVGNGATTLMMRTRTCTSQPAPGCVRQKQQRIGAMP